MNVQDHPTRPYRKVSRRQHHPLGYHPCSGKSRYDFKQLLFPSFRSLDLKLFPPGHFQTLNGWPTTKAAFAAVD